jgi:hypothetical protein
LKRQFYKHHSGSQALKQIPCHRLTVYPCFFQSTERSGVSRAAFCLHDWQAHICRLKPSAVSWFLVVIGAMFGLRENHETAKNCSEWYTIVTIVCLLTKWEGKQPM